MNEIIEKFGEFIYDLVEIIERKVNENQGTMNCSLEDFYKLVNRPFDSISTTYKQQACLEETGFYIPP